MNLINLYKRFKPSYYKAFRDLSIHVGMVVTTVYAMWYIKDSYISYSVVPLLALLHVKTFVMFHDCGHNSFTPSKKLNYIIGSALAIPVLTPFSWNYDHRNHHLISGNNNNNLLENQNHSIFHTFDQYSKMSNVTRQIYRIARYPIIFNIGVQIMQLKPNCICSTTRV